MTIFRLHSFTPMHVALCLMGLFFALPHLTATAAPCTFVQVCDTQLGMGGYDEDKARFRAAVKAINAMGATKKQLPTSGKSWRLSRCLATWPPETTT